MPFKGVLLKGEPYTSPKYANTELRDCVLCGTVAKDPKVQKYKTKKAKHSMKVDVLIKFDEGRSGSYISVWAFRDTYVARSLARLKWNEKAVILGTLVKRIRYVEGEELPIESVYLDPAFVIPWRVIETIESLAASDKFQKMIEEEFESEEGMGADEMEEAKRQYEKDKAKMEKLRQSKEIIEEDEYGFA